MQQLTFDALFDEWLARVVCARFGISPTPYVRMMNRATAETVEEEAASRSIVPFMQHFKSIFDDIINNHCHRPELEFVWTTQQLHYRMEDASIHSSMLHDGVITIDHVRKMRGLPPLENGMGASPMIWTGSGPMRLEDILSGQNQTQGMGLPGITQGGAAPQKSPFELSLAPEEEPAAHDPFELSLGVKAELSAWETFAVKRLRKANSRPFECKYIPDTLSDKIQGGLKGATTAQKVNASLYSP